MKRRALLPLVFTLNMPRWCTNNPILNFFPHNINLNNFLKFHSIIIFRKLVLIIVPFGNANINIAP